MKEIEIDITQFKNILEDNNCAFLCGNGFSINFDSDFCNIFNRLYEAHKEVIHNCKYKVHSNRNFVKKCKENYRSIINFLRSMTQDKLNRLFEDGLIFAESIVQNEDLVSELREKKLINRLQFGRDELDLVYEICRKGRIKGIEYVNIEYWPILVYFYFAINYLSSPNYKFPNQNSFITAIKLGNKSRIQLIQDKKEQIYLDVLLNGFTIYYRMLFSTAIFANGKGIKLEMLNKISNLNLDSISGFLNKFKVLFTLNYDKIMDNLTKTKVQHLHGEFVKDNEEYYYSQSLGLNYSDGYVSFSDILIGDYFILKGFLNTLFSLGNNNPKNKKKTYLSDIIDSSIRNNQINTVTIFGMSIDNDQHIIRHIISALYFANIETPRIIYCYFSHEDKKSFSEQYNNVIKFGKELSEYARNIEINYVRSKEILNEYFYKKG